MAAAIPNNLDNFQAIAEWKDVAPFADKIVAVKSDNYYFTDTYLGKPESFFDTCSVSGFTFPNTLFAFAHVTKEPLQFEGGYGYHLNSLIKFGAIQSTSVVNKYTLKEYGPLSLRLASTEELKKIHHIVSNKLAVFSTIWDRSAPKVHDLEIMLSENSVPSQDLKRD